MSDPLFDAEADAAALLRRAEAAEAEAMRWRGWLDAEAQAAGAIQRRLNAAEARVAEVESALAAARQEVERMRGLGIAQAEGH